LNGQLAGSYTIEQIIELAASKGAENGDLPKPIGSDFPTMGKPYRDLLLRSRHADLNRTGTT
jgi:hypothetical protein